MKFLSSLSSLPPFLFSFIRSFNKHLLHTYYMPSTIILC